MKEHSEESPDWDDQRMKIIGLGESSIRKSYYPELQQRLHELEQTNADLLDAIEEIQQKEEELRENYDELRNIQSALDLARKKLNLLNSLTFQDIQNALFSLSGYLTLTKEAVSDEPVQMYLEKSLSQMQKIERILHLAKQYQNMGIHPPKWQNVMEVYVFAVSHLDMSDYERSIILEGLEIFADPLLLENIVAVSLKKDELSGLINFYYWKNAQQEEIDFVVRVYHKIIALVQVCTKMDDTNTKEREVRALLKGAHDLKCSNLVMLTMYEEGEQQEEWFGYSGVIRYIPLWKWLLLPAHEKLGYSLSS